MTFRQEMDATEAAKELIEVARLTVVSSNHAAWLFLRRVEARLDERQEQIMATGLGL